MGANVIVTAISRDYPLSTASAAVTISGYSTSSLQGQFAFSMSGQIASGPFFRAGAFTADGAGNLTGGLEDINETSGVTSGLSFIGTYSVTSDGRGSLQFDDGHAPATINFVLVNGNQLQITGFDNSGTASGQATARDVTAFSNAALSGTYVFDFAGVQGSNGLSQIGEFTANGAGIITGGLMDSMRRRRGHPANLHHRRNVFREFQHRPRDRYPRHLQRDLPPEFLRRFARGGGHSWEPTRRNKLRASLPSRLPMRRSIPLRSVEILPFCWPIPAPAARLPQPEVFQRTEMAAFPAACWMKTPAERSTRTLPLTALIPSLPNGRGTASFTGGRAYVFYLGSVGNAVFQETDSIHPTSDGILAQQQSAAFSQALIAGNYAIGTSGLSGSSVETVTGELAANGAGSVTSGTFDVNTGGTLSPGVTLTGAYSASSSAERGTLTLTLPNPLNQTRNYAVYVINSPQTLPAQQLILIRIDAGLPAIGSLFRQF